MIDRVAGTVVASRPGVAVIDVGGIGLEIQVTGRAQAALGAIGERGSIVTRYIVREDAVTLYGFADEDEREGFDHLLAVAGVGPRLALATVSLLAPDRLRRTLAAGETGPLVGVPGVGKKLAQRMVLDLKDWAADAIPALGEDTPSAGAPLEAASVAVDGEEAATAVEALTGLGYGALEARAAVAAARRAGIERAEDLVRDGLRRLSRAAARSADEATKGA